MSVTCSFFKTRTMSEDHDPNVVIEISRGKPKPKWFVNLTDFANMVKAFIGSNYLSVAYAVSQSGLALGIFGMLLISGLTGHCCHLLVKTKYYIIKQVLEKQKKERKAASAQAQRNGQTHSGENGLTGRGENGQIQRTRGDGQDDDDDDDGYDETLQPFMARSIEQEGGDGEEDDSDTDTEEKEDYMKKHMTFGDIGQACYGNIGVKMVNFCIALTQFGFCTGYFIFLGNTIHSLFPVEECYVNIVTRAESCHIQKDTVHYNLSLGSAFSSLHRSGFKSNIYSDSTTRGPIYTLNDVTTMLPNKGTTSVTPSNITDVPSNLTTVTPSNITTLPSNITTVTPSNITTIPSNITTVTPSNITTIPSNITTVTPSNITTIPRNVTTEVPASNMTEIRIVEHAPSLIWLVAAPLPIFLAFALIRSVRYLGAVSVWANISILFGCVSVFFFLVIDFHISENIKKADIAGFTVFFGMVTGSFEGIGLVIPIESSMEGNRHLFPLFLTMSLLILTLILGCFGILGYLKYGGGPGGVEQMLNKNIPKGNPVGMAVNIGICIGILLTFPLQIFPVIEIIERALFCPGSICGPRKEKEYEPDEQEQLIGGDREPLLSDDDELASRVPDSTPSWKRNIVRVIIVLIACGLAILLRNYFAYVGAFIGSVGSSVLGFILPCLFHLKACWKDISVFVKIKNIIIIVFGVCASLVCAISTVRRVVTNDIHGE